MRNGWMFWGFLSMLALLVCSCDDEVTYSDMKEKERKIVKSFIQEQGIKIISYSQFIANDSTTNIENNEYVEIDDCYMQIVRNPKGIEGARRMKDGERLNVLVRYVEYNIAESDTISGNLYDSDNPDNMLINFNNGSYSATFTDGYMSSIYGSAVPSGWLVPLPYIYFIRKQSQVAKVNIIVPHTKGTSTAASYVYPCFYQITFTPEK